MDRIYTPVDASRKRMAQTIIIDMAGITKALLHPAYFRRSNRKRKLTRLRLKPRSIYPATRSVSWNASVAVGWPMKIRYNKTICEVRRSHNDALIAFV
jgi:hypothetical protein